MNRTWFSRNWSLVVVALARLLFVATFSANVGGDSLVSLNMMLKGESNLIIPPGYAFLFGAPARALFGAAVLDAHKATFLFCLMFLQHALAFLAIVLFHRMLALTVGLRTAHVVTLIVGLHWGFMAATSQIGPEWCQAVILMFLAFVIFTAATSESHRAKLVRYGLAGFLLAWAYLVKFNALYFAILFLPALLLADKAVIRRRIAYAAVAGAMFLGVVAGFKVLYQKPKTGTYALTHDRAWVLLFKSAYFCYLTPANGPNTTRLLLLNTLLPWDNQNVGSIPRIDFVSPEIEQYRQRFGWILTANEQQLRGLLSRTELRKDFNFFTAFSPTTWHLGLAEGDQLGVEVFKECVVSQPYQYAAHVLNWTFGQLLALPTIDPFPLNVDSGFRRVADGGWYWADGTTLKRNGNDPYDNPAGYWVFEPGIAPFVALRWLYRSVPNWFVTLVCVLGFVHALTRWRETQSQVVLFCGTLAFGFLLASNLVLDFRWYEELHVVLPYIALVFAASCMTLVGALRQSLIEVGAHR